MELVTKARTWDQTLLLFSTEQPDFNNTLHCQDRCKIFFVTRGSATVTKGNMVQIFAAGSLFFTHDTTAQLHIDHPDSFQCCGIYFASTIINDDLERLFALNRNQINQIFHQGAGCTSMQYLLNLRMDLARSLLRNTELPQKEIALRCGFQDYGHFCKTFFSGFNSNINFILLVIFSIFFNIK